MYSQRAHIQQDGAVRSLLPHPEEAHLSYNAGRDHVTEVKETERAAIETKKSLSVMHMHKYSCQTNLEKDKFYTIKQFSYLLFPSSFHTNIIACQSKTAFLEAPSDFLICLEREKGSLSVTH